MKLATLPKVAWSIENERYPIEVAEDIREGAKRALDRMLALV